MLHLLESRVVSSTSMEVRMRIPCHSVTSISLGCLSLSLPLVVCVMAVVPAVKFDTFYMTVIRPPITSPLLLRPLALSPSSQDALRRITRSPSSVPAPNLAPSLVRLLVRPMKQFHRRRRRRHRGQVQVEAPSARRPPARRLQPQSAS